MASKKYEQDSPERLFMAELYSFTEKFFYPEPENEKYWEQLVAEAIRITDQYASVRFAPMMIMDFITYLENEAKVKPKYRITRIK